jgi:acetyl-CoA acetyltransferase
MREAVIVSTARTGIGRAFKGSLNHSKSPSMLGHVIAQAVQRAGIEGAEVEDVVMGTVLTSGTAGMNLARNAALAAGLPVTAPGQTMDRQCASGLMAIATAAKQVMVEMLTNPATPEGYKNEIHNALTLDATLPYSQQESQVVNFRH